MACLVRVRYDKYYVESKIDCLCAILNQVCFLI